MAITRTTILGLAASLFIGFGQGHAAETYYVDPNSSAAAWVRQHPDDPRAQAIAARIARVPAARWFGDWNADIGAAVAKFVDAAAAAQRVPMLVAYDIPDRDCGGASTGGATDADTYRHWIDAFARGVGAKPAIVIVEPDALAQAECRHSREAGEARLGLLHYALSSLRRNAPGAKVYLDGGNAHWVPAAEMARRMEAAGIREARGFALNVSNFHPTGEGVAYAAAINAALAQGYGFTKAVVIDTSRNGNGSTGQWCNPPGARLGETPVAQSARLLLVWVKGPGTSDGPCGVGPSLRAGTFSPDLAIRLIEGR
ncbi:glycoside hydrolase family 6 protein [Robbsia sp. Bb-Pol-6]|uniref:Glucanase n=1 Tax=Robbsia betulipollinis TaxID=2981849 RepID=A0ABT3ZJM9_9BURK|nr:glycoside hydrolase family 6 protein [Robbsia betulipollinis]MCY0386729.1 glycoside hydrolase family 6 protein [Robbsia betulipollinis]